MAAYACVRECFLDGRLVRVGGVIESTTSPGSAFVPVAKYKPQSESVEAVATSGGFVVRGEGGKLIRAATATRLVGRSPHEWRF